MAITNIGSANTPASFGKWLETMRPGRSAGTDGLDALAKTGALKPSELTSTATTTQPASFSKMLDNAVGEVNAKMNVADTEQGKLITGETNNVHQAMIAVQEASVAFSLMVEVRNKLVDSYQELMRMQV